MANQYIRYPNPIGSGTPITGSGTATQVAYFSGTNTITGSSNLTWDGAILAISSTTGGIGINAVPNANAMVTGRRDQNGTTRWVIDNQNALSNAASQLSVNTDAGGLNLTAASVAGGAAGFLFTDSTFTGGLIVGTNGARTLALRTNNTTAITIDGSSQTVQIATRLGVEAGPGTDSTARIRGNSNVGANQYGLIVDTVHQSDATSTGYGIDAKIATTASSFTMSYAAAFQASAASKGSGSTITRLVNFGGAVQTAGTNNAFIADNSTFVGSWFLHSTNSLPCHISRWFEIETNEDPGAPTDAIRLGAQVTTDSGTPTTLSLRTEQAVEAIGTFTASHKLRVWINGVEYWVQLDAV